MFHQHRLFLAGGMACLAFSAAGWAQVAILPSAPEVGPPSISIGHETRNAMARAEAWLAKHPAPENPQGALFPCLATVGDGLLVASREAAGICQCLATVGDGLLVASREEEGICQCLAKNGGICQSLANLPELAPEEVEAMLPLLTGHPTADMDFAAFARLAAALHARGENMVFPAGGSGIPWRASLLQKLVMSQRVGADGTAYWVGADASEEGIRAATQAALCAIRFATTP